MANYNSSYYDNIALMVSRDSSLRVKKWHRHVMHEMGFVSSIKRSAKTIRVRYVVDPEDRVQSILFRAVYSGRGVRRHFWLVTRKEVMKFDGYIVSVERKKFSYKRATEVHAVANIKVLKHAVWEK